MVQKNLIKKSRFTHKDNTKSADLNYRSLSYVDDNSVISQSTFRQKAYKCQEFAGLVLVAYWLNIVQGKKTKKMVTKIKQEKFKMRKRHVTDIA